MEANHDIETSSARKGFSLIPAKRFADYVLRPELVSRIEGDLADRMILLVAPSGYGKASLLSELYGSLKPTSTNELLWLSLMDQGSKDELIQVLQEYANDLQGPGQRYILLDKVDLFSKQQLKIVLEILTELFLGNVRIALSSSKLNDELMAAYTKGLIKLYDRRDLAFSFRETQEYLTAKRDDATDDYVKQVFGFTEGWVEGIYLLSENADVGSDTKAFALNKFIDTFFIQKVTGLGFEDETRFLIQTSLLEALEPSVCNYLTGREDSLELLRQMELGGLYVSYSNGRTAEFYYDNPFKEWLRRRLLDGHSESAVRDLNQRAAQRYEDKGNIPMAAKHTLRATDVRFVEDLTSFSEGPLRAKGMSFQEWVGSLDPAAMQDDPFTSVMVAWAYICSGRSGDALLWTQFLREDLDSGISFGACPDSGKRLLGVRCIEAKCLSLRGRYPEAIEKLDELSPCIKEPDNIAMQCLFEQTYAESYEHQGDLEPALEHYRQAETLGEMGGYQLVTALCRYNLATIHYIQGDLSQAEAICRKALLDCPEDYPLYGGLLSLLARVEITENRLDEAKDTLSMVFAKLTEGRNVDILIDANNVKASLFRAEGDIEGAYKLSVKNVHIAERRQTVPRGTLLSALTMQAYYAYRLGMYYEADDLAQRARSMVVPGDTESSASVELLIARLLISSREYAQAQKLLSDVVRESLEKKLVKKRVEALLLQASLCRATGSSNQAVLSINEALEEGSKYNLIDIFLLEEDASRILICEMLSERKLRRETRQFAKLIIEQLEHTHKKPEQDDKGPLKRARLTVREQEVLKLLNLGMTRKEIAEELAISPNTAKVHIANIYSKLNVDNRLDAFHESLETES